MNFKKYNYGFTLIELMVVVAIIAILTSVIMANFTQAKAKGRDAKRISDLAQMQLALELMFDKCGVYPPNVTVDRVNRLSSASKVNASVCINPLTSSDYLVSDFITTVPLDPLNATPNVYRYEPSGTRYDYRIMANLETMTGASAGGTTGSIGSINCSSDTKNYCVAPR